MSSGSSNPGSTKLEQFQMPQVGDVLESRYEITDAVATGGMGVILQARHLRMGRDVAVKILHPHIAQDATIVARFEREVSLAQRLNHPNSIRLYDFGEAANGLLYVVMELLDGADLKEVCAEQGPLRAGRVVDLTLQVLDGLGEAHEQDFVHRDLKPSNIFITRDRHGDDLIKILDFGIAKSLEEGAIDLTDTGSICGTAAYVAPEYVQDSTPQKAADVYAVGLIMLEMLAGRRVFSGATTAQTLMMHVQRDVRVPDRIAATQLGTLISRATMKDPARRYQDADEMFEALAALSDDLPAELCLARHQVGELLCPPSATYPGIGHIAGRSSLAVGADLQNQNDSSPKSVDDQTLSDTSVVTPPPARERTTHEVPVEKPERGEPATSKDIWIGAAIGVAGIAAIVFLLAVSDGDSEVVQLEAIEQQQPELMENTAPSGDDTDTGNTNRSAPTPASAEIVESSGEVEQPADPEQPAALKQPAKVELPAKADQSAKAQSHEEHEKPKDTQDRRRTESPAKEAKPRKNVNLDEFLDEHL